jgi:hypothetical protein
MGSVVISGATSGAVTLAVPDEAGTRTLTLPATTGTILTNDISQAGDTSAGNAAAVGYTSAEGLILTGQGSTSDVTIKNDADATVISIPTGSNHVGIGTTSPATELEIYNAGFTAAQITSNSSAETQLRFATNTAARISNQANTALIFDTNATERMRIDSSGKVGIGTTTPGAELGFPIGNNVEISQVAVTAHQAGNAGHIALTIADGGGHAGFFVNNTHDGTYSDTHLSFKTGEGGISVATERMRITSDGKLLVGYTSSNGAYKLQVNSQIFATSATIATSDGNYKENITPLDGALSLVSQLNPVQFDWKEHPVHEFDRNQPTIGFIAQEVQQVLAEQPYLNSIVKSNECVLEPEETDDEGNVIKEAVTEPFLGIAEVNMVALLTAAIKEQQATITALETRLTALEAN